MSIRLEHLNYIYSPKTAYEKHALKDICLEIPDGEFVGIIGHTGSGKSTLIQHFNGLIKATDGKLFYNEENIYEPGYNMKNLRNEVGLVFQYPEHQLFEIDVMTDVCFGPKNQGLSSEECKERALKALELVGLKEKYYHSSPFELSGGQKRRAAIAGVLAMRPKVLVLDEPTAGLDPKGRDDILDQVAYLHKQTGMTVILVSHSMEDIARYADRIIVMNHGEVMYNDAPRAVFAHYRELEQAGLAAPQVTYIMHDLKERGLPVDISVTTVSEAADEIMKALGGKDLGNTAAGNRTSGDGTPGNRASGDTASASRASGNEASGSRASGDTASGSRASGNTVSEAGALSNKTLEKIR